MVSNESSDDLAIVGGAFRFPGASTRGALWEMLIGGRDAISRVAADRFAQEVFEHPRKSEPGTSYTFAAGSLGDVAGFDAEFFGISPREAIQMDPQQRILLELAWEACEDAGLPPSRLRGTRCGVFLGISGTDYAYRRADDLASIDATTMTGNTASIAANRLSYVFDLHGPSMAIDTACSSALVAFHQACRSVRSGESSAALTGAIGLHLHPFGFIGFSKATMLSRRGLCTPFDADGDGYVRSEGGGLLLIKRLDQALADGDRVLAVVLGSGLNTDGRKQGLTVPNPQVQAELLADIYRQCGIAPDEIDYLEAHGTGTVVGDPLETRALGEALGRRRAAGHPLLIGSVKGNLGHLEVASGMAGLVKAMLCLEHRAVPPTIPLQRPNPNIDFAAWNLQPATGVTALDAQRRLVVGVSSFGFGGANAHVVLASPAVAASLAVSHPPPESLPAPPLILSARTPAALDALARAMATHLREHPDQDLYDLAAAAALRREPMPHRLAVYAADRESRALALERFADGAAVAGLTAGRWLPAARGPVFVYAGNGSQWVGMGRALLDEDATFRAAITAVDALFSACGGFSILAELAAPAAAERLAATEVAQPLLFAIQVGLTRRLAQLGIVPVAVVGHSVGEVAAAWACGALTLEAAVAVIHERSAQQGTTRGTGQMTAVALGEGEAQALIESLGLADGLCVAGINSERSVTLAGSAAALAAIESALAARGVWCLRLALDYAFHSPAMDPLRADLVAALAALRPADGTIPFYSTVTGAVLAGHRLDADYWWRNVREPVRFAGAVTGLLDAGYNVLLEIGPAPILRGYLNEASKSVGQDTLILPTLTREAADRAQVDRCFHQLLLSGVAYDWARLFPRPARFVDGPRYPWQHERYWLDSSPEGLQTLARHQEHSLLGYRLPGDAPCWENHLDTSLYPYLADHAVGDTVVLPAAGFAEMALAAAALWQPGRVSDLQGLDISTPLLLERDRSKVVRLAIDPRDGGFTIRSRDRQSTDPWLLHAAGHLAEVAATERPTATAAVPERAPDADAQLHYQRTEGVGLDYGPAFRAVEQVWISADRAAATLITPASVEAAVASARLHPAYLDAAFQLLADLLAGQAPGVAAPAFIPIRVERLRLLVPGARVTLVEARLRRLSRRAAVADFRLFDGAGALVALVDTVRLRAVQLRRPTSERVRQIATVAIPRPRLRDTARCDLAAAADLAALVSERWCDPERLASRARYFGEVEPLLDAMCGAFAQRALRTLDPHGTWFDPVRWLDTGLVTAASEPLLRYLLRMLTEDGVLESLEERWWWRDESALPNPTDIWISLMGDYPDHAGLIGPAGRAGYRLPEVLTGAMGPEQVTPADADRAALGPLGAEPGIAQRVAASVSDLIRDLAVRLPPGRRPRVIELIGAAPQAVCLAALLDAPPCELVVAAPDRERCQDLAIRLRQRPRVRTCVVDPGDPAATLMTLGGWFDLVLLGSGLAGEAPIALLAQVRSLIAEGGVLVVCEQYPSRAHDLCCGLHPGWWSNRQPPRSRLRAPESWQSLLGRYGFTDSAIVPDVPTADAGHYLLLARQCGAVQDLEAVLGALAATGAPTGPWCIVIDATPYAAALGQALVALLAGRGRSALCVVAAERYVGLGAPGAPVALPLAQRDAWQQVLEDLRGSYGEPTAIVHLAGLEPDQIPVDAADCLNRQEWRANVVLAALQGGLAAGQRPGCYVVTAGAGVGLLAPALVRGGARSVQDAPLWALARVAMNEFAEQSVRWVDLAESESPSQAAARLADELLEPDGEDEVILCGGARFVPRLQVLGSEPVVAEAAAGPQRCYYLDFTAPGPLKNLIWLERDAALPGVGEVAIAVRAVGLNFRDVMYTMGLLPDEALESGFSGQTLGMELAGVVTAIGGGVTEICVGEEVIAFAPAAFSNQVTTRASAVVSKPKAWSFAAAATVPTTFFTAYYALVELARLGEGERILIHGAAGGVGLAAIQIAKMLGAEVFATAGSAEKRDCVRMLGADHVLDSRSLAFADDILAITGGQGVDCVLNSLTGEAINRNLRVLRPFGRFLELGKRDFYENTHVGLRPFRNNIAYFGIDADQLLIARPDLARRVFLELMSLFGRALLKPLPYRAFAADEVVDAFRYMQHSRQIGKVVVTLPPDFAPPVSRVAIRAPWCLRADATYLVTGGLSGFGLRTAQWLAGKGASSLVLLSRRGEDGDGAPQAELAELRAAGVRVYAPPCDVTDAAALAGVLDAIAADLPPLRGVVHAAMVIDDGLLRTTTPAQWHRVLAPKVLGALHLDAATRGLPLDFFVLYSSATTLFGSPGQGSYVAANMVLEALAVDRRARGETATCIGWGPIEDVGFLARNAEIKEALVARMGGQPLRSEECLGFLEQAIGGGQSNLGILDLVWGTIGRQLASAGAPKFSELAAYAQDAGAGADGSDDLRRWLDGLEIEALRAAVVDILRRELAEILRLVPEKIEVTRSLYDMGMDSLMGVELITALDARLGIALPVMAVSEGPTIARLSERIVHQLRPSAVAEGAVATTDARARQVGQIAEQHGDVLDPTWLATFSQSMDEPSALNAGSFTRGVTDDLDK
ncbi:type I polyketide synthase [uncultured Thiodictyon sp.]|uniref:type I polyketide synthase n=3 Tax=uncultured Thiodictyon sp. TaxID=1846217 RepID=UPI0025F8BC35|nr:type I polyketide synthase [uncultured Thiodictyon sp.]